MFVVILLIMLVLVTSSPPEIESMELFAMIGTGACSSSLYYGPSSVKNSYGTYSNFLSTSTTYKNVPSRNWVQVVTSDGSYELFRIYWTFDTAKTMAEHIADAVSVGESVTYKVVTNLNKVFEYSGVWRFSSNSGITLNTFSTTTTKCCFSRTNGLWGADSGTIDAADGSQRNDDSFWGQGNFRSDDSTECQYVYMLGTAYSSTKSSPVSYLYHSTVTSPTTSPTISPSLAPSTIRPSALPTTSFKPTALPTAAPSTVRPTARPSTSHRPTTVPTLAPSTAKPTAQPSITGQNYGLVSFRVTLKITGLSVTDYRASPTTYDDLFGKILFASMQGISEHDISMYSVASLTTSTSAASSTIDTDTSSIADIVLLDDLVPLNSLLPASTLAAHSPRASALVTPAAHSQQASALVTLAVSRENSAYSYDQLMAQLALSDSNGTLNTWLYNYAVYLELTDMTSATATVYSTQLTEDKESTAEEDNLSWVTPTVVMVSVLAAMIAAGYCWRKGWSCQRSDQVDVGSTHSVAVLDSVSEGEVTPRSALHTGGVNATWVEHGVGVITEDVEMQYITTPPRSTTSAATPTIRVVQSSSGQRATGRRSHRHLHSQSTPALPRGAPVVAFSPPLPSVPPISCPNTARSVVEITPRGVQVMQSFTASMRNNVPVVRAHAIHSPSHTSTTRAVEVTAIPVSARSVNSSYNTAGSSYIIAEAEVDSS